MHDMFTVGSTYIPLSAPSGQALKSLKYLNGDMLSKPYGWSAYMAAAIESCTLPFRLSTGSKRLDMLDLQRYMNPSSSNALAALSMALPLPVFYDHEVCLPIKNDRLSWAYDMTLGAMAGVHSDDETASFSVFRGTEFLTKQAVSP